HGHLEGSPRSLLPRLRDRSGRRVLLGGRKHRRGRDARAPAEVLADRGELRLDSLRELLARAVESREPALQHLLALSRRALAFLSQALRLPPRGLALARELRLGFAESFQRGLGVGLGPLAPLP